jgi:hypothetical protein
MKKTIAFLTLVALLTVTALAQQIQNPYPAWDGSGFDFIGLATNGQGNFTTMRINPARLSLDPLVERYANARGITDQNAKQRLNNFVYRLRQYTNSFPIYHWDFNPCYNPTNHVDLLFGNTNCQFIGAEVYDGFGAVCRFTNGIILRLPQSLTNFTVFINRKNTYADQGQIPGTLEQSVGNYVPFNFSFETTGNSNGYYFGGDSGFTHFKCWQTDGTNYPCSKNFNNSPPYLMDYAGLKDASIVTPVTYPHIDCYSSDCLGHDTNYMDIVPGASGGSLALNVGAATNLTGINEIHFGISSNWNSWFYNLGWTGGTTTNGDAQIFTVTVYPTLVTYAMVTNYFAANAELCQDDNWQIFAGTSMMAEYANRYWFTPAFPAPSFTNNWPYMVSLTHPKWNWRNYSQGGSSMATFTNNPSFSNGRWPLDTLVSLLYNGKRKIEVITDYPRNDVLDTSAHDFNAISVGMVNTFQPIKNAGATLTIFESVTPCTNNTAGTITSGNNRMIAGTNLFGATINVRTNTGTLINKIVPAQAYLFGAMWNTNAGYFLNDAAGGQHIEGSNSTIMFQKQAFLFNTGFWPETNTMPTLTNSFQ